MTASNGRSAPTGRLIRDHIAGLSYHGVLATVKDYLTVVWVYRDFCFMMEACFWCRVCTKRGMLEGGILVFHVFVSIDRRFQ